MRLLRGSARTDFEAFLTQLDHHAGIELDKTMTCDIAEVLVQRGRAKALRDLVLRIARAPETMEKANPTPRTLA